MYIPKHYLNSDRQAIIAFMKKYSFATIVTMVKETLEATHLPFLVEEREEKLILSSHFAIANPQSKEIEHQNPLVIFTEPHAYISPKHYEKELNVPTWNYLAVHAYGKAKILKDEEEKFHLMEKTIINYEEHYLKQWNHLPMDYKLRMLKGIVMFEIEVTDFQAKNKLSQNKTAQEQQNIIDAFIDSNDANENQIAAYMKSLYNK